MPARRNVPALLPIGDGGLTDAEGVGQHGVTAESVNEFVDGVDVGHSFASITDCYLSQDHTSVVDGGPSTALRSGMTIDRYDTGKLRSDVARRLLAIREAYALDQQQFGVRAGLSQPQYNQYETGSRTLTLKSAIKLCDTYGLTLDYLYRGDPSGLPYRLAEAIRTGSRLSTGSAEN